MPERFSVYLDLVRFLAAIAVVLSHFAYARFSDGYYLFLRDWNIGSDAVVIFFVLSGFVIAYTTEEKDRNAKTFAFNRLTRLLSVVIPALAVTFVCDRLGYYLAPETYSAWWYNPLSMAEFFLLGLTFSNEWAGLATRLGTNGPFWSLSYEAAYYALFAAFIFTSGLRRIVILAAGCLLFGINILLLAPAWVFGVLAYRATRNEIALSQTGTALLLVLTLVVYLGFAAIGMPQFLIGLTALTIGADAYSSLGFSNEFIWNNLIAGLFAAHLIAAFSLMRNAVTKVRNKAMIRWLAGATFSIYLIHYPVMQMLSVVLPETGMPFVNHGLLLGLTLVACFIFAEVFERRLSEFRDLTTRITGMRNIFLKPRPSA